MWKTCRETEMDLFAEGHVIFSSLQFMDKKQWARYIEAGTVLVKLQFW